MVHLRKGYKSFLLVHTAEMNTLRTIRNHWKKSVVISAICAYGCHYAVKKYRESVILKAYCIEAKKYGDAPVRSAADRPRKVTVFLNPAASKGKGRQLFDKNVAPLLHLASNEVTIILTECEGQAKKYADVLYKPDAILVTGGNGTLSEVVTGLLRRSDQDQFSRVPIGVVPVGKTNTLASFLCPTTKSQALYDVSQRDGDVDCARSR
jgi:acylglycerol kinase